MRNLTPDQYTQLIVLTVIILLGLGAGFVFRPRKRTNRPGPPHTPSTPLREMMGWGLEQVEKTVFRALLKEYLPRLVDDQKTAHLLLVGPTKIGKTTFAKLLVQERVRSGHQVVILDPDSALDTWGDLVVFGGGDDFETIDRVLLELMTEFQERGKKRSASREEDARFPPVTVVIDEIPALQTKCSNWTLFFEELGSRGRKRQIHLILLTQSSTVNSLGIEGKGQLRENFTKVNLQKKEITSPEGVVYEICFEIEQLLKSIDLEFLDRRWAWWTEEELEKRTTTPPHPAPGTRGGAGSQHTSSDDGMGVIETRDWKKEDLVRWLAEETDLSQSKVLEWFKGDQTTLVRWMKETREAVSR